MDVAFQKLQKHITNSMCPQAAVLVVNMRKPMVNDIIRSEYMSIGPYGLLKNIGRS